MRNETTMIATRSLSRRMLCALPVLALTGCMPQQSAQMEPVIVTSAPPPQRSYLDAGPVPAAGGGPNYVRDSLSTGARQTDAFGTGVLPRTP